MSIGDTKNIAKNSDILIIDRLFASLETPGDTLDVFGRSVEPL